MQTYSLQTAASLLTDSRGQSLTKKAATEAARASRPAGTTIASAVEEILSAAEHILAQRKSRFARRAAAHGVAVDQYRLNTWQQAGRKPVQLPSGTLVGRLYSLRIKAVLAAYRATVRVPGNGHGEERVFLTADPTKVGIKQSQRQDWDLYSKSCRYPATVTDTDITVPSSWRRRVEKQGLASVDGMFTLDAQPLMGAPEGVRLFAARWVQQGRGYSVSVVDGVIAVAADGTAYHAANAKKALTGLRRKQTLASLPAAELDRRAEKARKTRLDKLVERCGTVTMTVDDAREIGACEYGIYSWCHAVGIDPEKPATLAKVVYGYWQRPQSEAYAAILHAARRC